MKKTKPLSKRQKKLQEMEKMRRKQLEIAWEYPYCRRCKEPIDPAYAKKQKKAGQMPLCKKCFEPMMKQYGKLIEQWQTFNKR